MSKTESGGWLKLLWGVGAFGVVWLLTGGLTDQQQVVASVFAATVALWVTEALPLAVTALLSTTLLVLLGGLPGREAFGAYGDQIIVLFIGSFIIAKAMEDSGLDRRAAYWLMSKPWATRSLSSTLLSLGAIACVLSLFVSNTATTAMLLPIGRTILKEVGHEGRGDPVSTSVLLMLTWGSSIAVGTIIGTPPNVIGVALVREATGVSVNFVEWAVFAMPVTAVMLLLAWLQLRRPLRGAQPETARAHEHAKEEYAKVGRFSDAEKGALGAFLVALTFWVAPGLVEYALGSESPVAKALTARVPEAVAALLGATVLFVWPAKGLEGGRVMTWARATRIEWGTILLFAGGLALGKATFDSGLAQVIGEGLAAATGARDVWAITALSIALAIALSELASNTASATTVVPVAIALSNAAGVSPVPAALGATVGASLGFMLPISTAPNAIVYSTGLIPPGVMFRRGFVFDVLGFLVTLGCLRVILPLLGLA